MKKLWKNKWVRAAIVAIPFTGIIAPEWFVFLFIAYFIVGGYYLFIDTEPVDVSHLLSEDGGKWDDQEESNEPPKEGRDD